MAIYRQYLLLHPKQRENAYGPYVQEILQAEGLNGFHTVNLDEGLPELRGDDLIILTRCFLRREEMERLFTAVESGARLVVLHPSILLCDQFGWEPQKRAVHPGWVQTGEGYPGHGMPIQTHIPIAAFQPHETVQAWETLAGTVDAGWQDAGCPAVASQQVGKGTVVFFFYQLRRPPCWQARAGRRADDLHVRGHLGADPGRRAHRQRLLHGRAGALRQLRGALEGAHCTG